MPFEIIHHIEHEDFYSIKESKYVLENKLIIRTFHKMKTKSISHVKTNAILCMFITTDDDNPPKKRLSD